MFVRFQVGVLLAALVAIGGSALEGAALDRRRSLGRQHYQVDVLRERVARLRLRCEELGAPARLTRPIEERRPAGVLSPPSESSDPPDPEPSSMPLLRWRISPGEAR